MFFYSLNIELPTNILAFAINQRTRHEHSPFVYIINAVKVFGGVGIAAALPLTTRLAAFTFLQKGSDEKSKIPYDLAEYISALLEIAESVEARAGGREQDNVPVFGDTSR